MEKERLEKDFLIEAESPYELLDEKYDAAFLGIDIVTTKPIYDLKKLENLYLFYGVKEEELVDKMDKELFCREDVIFVEYFNREDVLFSKKLRKIFSKGK